MIAIASIDAFVDRLSAVELPNVLTLTAIVAQSMIMQKALQFDGRT